MEHDQRYLMNEDETGKFKFYLKSLRYEAQIRSRSVGIGNNPPPGLEMSEIEKAPLK